MKRFLISYFFNRRICGLLCVCCCLSGCASLKESAKGFAGISTKSLQEERKTAIASTFNCDYFSCYTKTLDVLKNIKAYVYAKDIKKRMIAIYVSEEDTTPVGIFFSQISSDNTKIEVSSPSTYAKELISEKLFAEFSSLAVRQEVK